jgi:hypothetical protein
MTGALTEGGVIDGGLMEGTEGAEGMVGIEGADGIDGVFSDGVLTGLFKDGVFSDGACPDNRLRNRMPAIAVLLTFASAFPSVPVMVMKSGNGT